MTPNKNNRFYSAAHKIMSLWKAGQCYYMTACRRFNKILKHISTLHGALLSIVDKN